MQLYLAYGSNLNLEQMSRRCPKAKPVGSTFIDNARLVFRYVADIQFDAGHRVPVGVWKITDECEDALDRYEGVKGGLYRKVYLPMRGRWTGCNALVYMMNDTGIVPPSYDYVEAIRSGYRSFRLDQSHLDAAIHHAWGNKTLTPITAKRREKSRKKVA